MSFAEGEHTVPYPTDKIPARKDAKPGKKQKSVAGTPVPASVDLSGPAEPQHEAKEKKPKKTAEQKNEKKEKKEKKEKSEKKEKKEKKEKLSKKGVPLKSVQPAEETVVSAPAEGGIAKPKRKRRQRRGKKALRMIVNLQKTVHKLLPKASFRRLVREVAQKEVPDMRFTDTSLFAVQEGLEDFLDKVFRIALKFAIHRRGVTLEPQDMQLVKYMLNNPLPLPSSNASSF